MLVIHSLIRLKLMKHKHMKCHEFKEKKLNLNKLGNECVKDMVH
jgi:hypothetical protein